MLYLANASSEAIREEMAKGAIGMLTTPREGRSPALAKHWAADNGCFGKGYPGDARYLAWLAKHSEHSPRCLFATAPDVVGDAVATWERSLPLLRPIKDAGYKPALVGQDGIENLPIQWSLFEAFFIGGSTEWKLSPEAASVAREAKAKGKWLHMGRVNSFKRLKYAHSIGCDSVDGTFLAFGPATNLPRLQKWFEKLEKANMELVA